MYKAKSGQNLPTFKPPLVSLKLLLEVTNCTSFFFTIFTLSEYQVTAQQTIHVHSEKKVRRKQLTEHHTQELKDEMIAKLIRERKEKIECRLKKK